MIRFTPLTAVKDTVRKGGIFRLEHACASRVGMPDNASIINAPRLLVALRCAAKFEAAGCEGVRRITLSPGEGLYVPSLHWVKSSPARPYQTLGLIFYPDLTRLYIMESVREQKVWRMRMRAADERAALNGPLANSLFALLDKPGSDPAAALREKAAANLLLAECARLEQAANTGNSGGKAWQHWQAARHYVDGHLQEPLDRQRVADVLRLHPNHLSRLFKRFNDLSFNRYITQARMARAELLLEDATLNVSDIAYLCGFTSPNYFIRQYRLAHGCPPGRHRASKVSE